MKSVLTLALCGAATILVSCVPYEPVYPPVPGAMPGPAPIRRAPDYSPTTPTPAPRQIPDSTTSTRDSNGYSPTDPARPYRPDPITIPDTTTTSSGDNYRVATPGVKPDTVISPYPPYNVIKLNGLKSGQKSYDMSTIPIDPSTGKQYRDASGNLDKKKAKIFIVP